MLKASYPPPHPWLIPLVQGTGRRIAPAGVRGADGATRVGTLGPAMAPAQVLTRRFAAPEHVFAFEI